MTSSLVLIVRDLADAIAFSLSLSAGPRRKCSRFAVNLQAFPSVRTLAQYNPRRHVGPEGEALPRSRPLCPSLLRQRDLPSIRLAMLSSQ
jgi:hypothetical protein